MADSAPVSVEGDIESGTTRLVAAVTVTDGRGTPLPIDRIVFAVTDTDGPLVDSASGAVSGSDASATDEF